MMPLALDSVTPRVSPSGTRAAAPFCRVPELNHHMEQISGYALSVMMRMGQESKPGLTKATSVFRPWSESD